MTDHEEFEKWWLTKFSAEFLDSDNCWSAWTGWQARGELDAVKIKELEAEIAGQFDYKIKCMELTAKNKVAEESELLALRNNDGLRMQINELAAKLDKARDGDCCTEGCIKCDARKILAETQEPFDVVQDSKGNLVPLYTTPPSREWVGLSDADKVIIAFDKAMPIEAVIAVTEAKLREKNG